MTKNIALRPAARWRQLVGGGLLAATLATGLTLGAASIANADSRTQTEVFRDCKTRATPDTIIVCCIASGGQVSTWPDGSYMGCATRNVLSNPAPQSHQPGPSPKPGTETLPDSVRRALGGRTSGT